MTTPNDVLGNMCGVRFRERAEDDPHLLVQLMIEDDGHWHPKDFVISSHWLDELIDVLEAARNVVKGRPARAAASVQGPPRPEYADHGAVQSESTPEDK